MTLRYALARIVLGLLSFVLTAIVTFLLVHLAPGDPAIVLAGEFATDEVVEGIRDLYGLNEPVLLQLQKYLARLFQGDLGFSYAYSQPVLDLIASRLPATLLLLAASQVFGIALGLTLGLIAGRRYGTAIDNATTTLASLLYSIPVFWLGMLAIMLFSIRLDWFPPMGISSLFGPRSGLGRALDVAHHLVLPSVTLALVWVAPVTFRIARSSVNSVQQAQYITTAKSKGLAAAKVLRKHVLRNALLPIVTIIGLNLSRAVSGSLLTETVFAWPGIGRLTYEALSRRDYPLLMGGFLLAAASVIVGMIAVDFVYRLIDPRIEYK